MPELVLQLLGPFRARLDGRVLTGFESNKVRALLAYLAVEADRPHSRDELIGLLWPDRPDATARANLRQSLANLRIAIGDRTSETPFLSATSDSIQINRIDRWLIDVIQFTQLVAVCKTHMHRRLETCHSCAQRLQQAVELYRGDFLAQFIQGGSEAFEEWALIQRERLHREALEALNHLTQHFEWRGDFAQALQYARRQLELDPWREEAHRQAMRALALTEQCSAALAQYEACRRVLADELAAKPAEETTALYEQIKAGTVASVQKPWLTPSTPLIGREAELAEANAIWHKARTGEGQVLLISGEPGIGKTRLVHELIAQERYSRAHVLLGECYAEGSEPFAPIAQAILAIPNSQLPIPNSQSHQDASQSSILADLIAITPTLRERFPQVPPNLPLEPQAEQQRRFDSVAHLLEALAAHAPVMLIVEDAHWADNATLLLLRHLARRLRRARVLIVATHCETPLDETRLFREWQGDLQRERLATSINLARLDRDQTHDLLAAIFKEAITPEFLFAIYYVTDGNPFLVSEVCQALIDEGAVYREGECWQRLSMAQIQIPLSVRRTIQRRVNQLPQATQEVLYLAAALGREFQFDVLRAMSDLSEEVLIVALETAQGTRLIDEIGQGRPATPAAFEFIHALIPATLHDGLTGPRRQRLHRQAAEALRKQYAADLDSVSVRIAQHYEQAGQADRAAEFYWRGAEAARCVYANQDALDYYRHALRLIEPSSDQVPAVYEGLGDVLALIGQRDEAQIAFERALQHTPLPITQARLYRKQGKNWEAGRQSGKALVAYDYAEAALRLAAVQDAAWWAEWIDNRLDQIGTLYQLNYQSRLDELVGDLQPVIDQQASLTQQGRFYGDLASIGNRRDRFRSSDETLAFAYAALEASRAAGDQSDLAFSEFRVGLCHLWRDEFDQADKHFQASATANEPTGSALNRLVLCTYQTMLYRRRGQLEPARQLAEQCLTLCAEQANLTYQGMAHANLAWVAWRAAQLPETQRLGQLALETWRDLGMTNPLRWLALWPLLGVAVRADRPAEALDYARTMLDPSQQRLPDQLTDLLESALRPWDQHEVTAALNHLDRAIALAEVHGYL